MENSKESNVPENDSQQDFLRSIENIFGTNRTFNIPAYQRGYRWGKREVTALLNDIWEFANTNKEEGSFYCLQPLMLREQKKDVYNVVDGQQRLTTLYLIATYLGMEVNCKLKYESRGSLTKILENPQQGNSETPDNYCVTQAYEVIKNWFENKENAIDKEKFSETLKRNTKLIWYEQKMEISEQESFDHLNRGKIPLTSAELLKGALYLNLPNDEKRLLGTEWDSIEHLLQRPEVWGFISEEIEKEQGRIELLFDIYFYLHDKANYTFSCKKKDTPYIYDGIMAILEEEKKKQNFDNQACYKQLWKEIKALARQIEYLHDTPECYHYIGFLMYQGKSIKDIWELIKGQTKPKQIEKLKEKIKESFKKEDVTYENFTRKLYTETEDYRQLKFLLLLFNVLTCLNTPNHERFPFYLYTQVENDPKNTWSLEHILPQRPEEKEMGITTRLKILDEQIQFLKDKIEAQNIHKEEQEKIKEWQVNWDDKNLEELQNLETAINDRAKIHYIYNLALLDKNSNSELSNKPFYQKVDKIKEFCANKTKFIPPATKNAFLKFYSKQVKNFHLWTKKDREEYKEILKGTLKDFLPEK